MTALPKPRSSWHIMEHAPLAWLIAIIFDDDFWDLQRITQSHFDFTKGNDMNAITPPRFKNFDAVYKAAEEFVTTDEDAKVCYEKALAAIASGELCYHEVPRNEWGDKIGYGRDDDMDSFEFLKWLEAQGYGIPNEVLDACAYIVMRENDRKNAAEKEAYSFPKITPDDFQRVCKEPLWGVGTAILYLLGRRSRREGKEHEYKGDDALFDKVLRYAEDANRTHLLILAIPTYVFPKVGDEKSKDDHAHQYTLDSKVEPQRIIEWAKTLPLQLPMLTHEPVSDETTGIMRTAEMQLMFAAQNHFWSDYPNKPAPLKKIVVGWLNDNASRFGIEKLSNNIAEAIDTLIRPADARSGGLKSIKG